MTGPDTTRLFAVTAATVWGNRGAEAMLESTLGRVRDLSPGARFAVYSYLPSQDPALVSDPGITIHSLTPAYLVSVIAPLSCLLALMRWVPGADRIFPASVRDMRRADALLDLAGVSFIDGREKFLPFNILTIAPAMLLGTPVLKLSQAMGPFRSPANRLASRILRLCELVVARGAGTVEHLRDAGFPEGRMLSAPDTAFCFEPRDSLSDEGAAESAEMAGGIERLAELGVATIGLCPSSVIAAKAASEGWDYTGFLAAIVEGLVAAGHAVALFPNATRASSGERLRNNDLPIIAAVADRIRDEGGGRVFAVRGDICAKHIRTVVERCNVVAVSRFHAMVGALAAGVPVMVLGWSHKYAEVMADFGLEDLVFDYSDHDAAAFLERLLALVDDRDEVARSIAERLPEVRARALAQFEAVLARVGPR